MFVVSLNYLKSHPEVDQHLEAHLAWLKAQYAAGRFIASGRKVPRTGGVILARGACRAELESWLAADPFAEAGVATYDLIEFVPNMTAPEFTLLYEAPAA
jgi:uncharacterized protein YciI